MTWLLRHGALKEKEVVMDDFGFVAVSNLIEWLHGKGFRDVTPDTIDLIVRSDKKGRFILTEGKIAATQGHTLLIRDPSKLLVRITPDMLQELGPVAHGTHRTKIPLILRRGLSSMKRNHIHFATLPSTPPRTPVSGLRDSSDVLIYLNCTRVLSDGIPLYLSANKVVLCPGGPTGVLANKYFDRIVSRSNGEVLWPKRRLPRILPLALFVLSACLLFLAIWKVVSDPSLPATS
eukprot:Sspe_Gene.98111::Locus_71567_Transcript_1_1_Confidence_1.000_Length_876::g.98111::m.98111/K10669/TRPT1, TPT1; 2'-phosphotransferase